MPIIKSAIKRMRQTTKRRERNIETKKSVKAATKAFLEKPSAEGLSKVHGSIDTAVKKNVLGKHTAARRKSVLSRIAKEAGVKFDGKKKVESAKPAVKKPAATTTATKKPAVKKTTAIKKSVAAKKPAAKK